MLKQLPILTLGMCAVMLVGCSSDKTIGASADRQYDKPAGCPQPPSDARGVLTLSPGTVKKATNVCFEPVTASYGGKPAKIIWGSTSPLGPFTAELTNQDGSPALVAVRGRTGTQMTLQQGSARIAVNFNVNAMDVKSEVKTADISTSTNFKGSVTIPPLRGLNYLDSRGRGSDVGYDEALGLYASEGEYAEEATKESAEREVEDGELELQVQTVDVQTGTVAGNFISKQPTGLAALKGELEIKGRFIGTFQ
ncbi:photosystem II manganese-stabilizing polypeptide [Candidatus Cyanaurora vandensis]|uniref:photosystem II manganese-stabilizing polypeptide n=1 Tax=Candidatus Cyanaurora vandensis TaxID=2714958 RepID=UPI00257C191A|nr:photosystem II manganese-stabilizing polypeptide [Candidatus Cyanaurora vandensis]